jgi:hypothetical protein
MSRVSFECVVGVFFLANDIFLSVVRYTPSLVFRVFFLGGGFCLLCAVSTCRYSPISSFYHFQSLRRATLWRSDSTPSRSEEGVSLSLSLSVCVCVLKRRAWSGDGAKVGRRGWWSGLVPDREGERGAVRPPPFAFFFCWCSCGAVLPHTEFASPAFFFFFTHASRDGEQHGLNASNNC